MLWSFWNFFRTALLLNRCGQLFILDIELVHGETETDSEMETYSDRNSEIIEMIRDCS